MALCSFIELRLNNIFEIKVDLKYNQNNIKFMVVYSSTYQIWI